MGTLSVRNVGKRFGGVVALDGVSLDVESGRVLGLLGANGSGKSTLCRIIAGELSPDTGQLLLDGLAVVHASPQDAAGRGIVIAHQHPALVPDLPVWENLSLGAERCWPGGFIDRRSARRDAAAVFTELGAPIDVDRPAGDLTAGQQQTVEIARALLRRPRLLILDEPTAALDADEVDRLFAAIRRMAQAGAGIVFISHRLHEVEAICDSLVVLRNGREAGSWRNDGAWDEARLLRAMTGDEPAVTRPANRRGPPGAVVLRLDGLRAGAAVRGVDLELRKGEVVGLAGLQGHGQEELLEALAGLRRIDGGRLTVHGQPVVPRLPRDMIRRGVCLVPNDRLRQGLFAGDTVGDNLGYVRISLDRRPWRLPVRELRAFVAQTLRRLLIKASGPDQTVATLSGGNQQKVVIGKWLAAPIEVMLMSDPTKGVDVHARTEIYGVVAELVAAGSAALVFASDVDELLRHCDRILVMYEGRIVDSLVGTRMSERHVMAAAFGKAA